MAETISFVVYGNPQALKRHRSFKSGIHIDPSKGDKADFLTLAIEKKPQQPWRQPIALHVEFFFQRPKSHYGTGRNADKLKPSAPDYHTSTPDTDNLIKFVCDSLNGVFYKDDSYICSVKAVKYYDCTPRTVISFKKL